ncbi:helix-turn-helix domain-containing protein [Streptomyces sp. NPDC059740]|uniref:helix-turn-helix domain-containing protein n=1 Tax=Streptomyces sp. NPDC059740 TaxID=3346926 RepID=UPI003660E48F
MGNQNPSVPPHAQSAVGGNTPPARGNPRPRRRPADHRATAHPAGVTHDNTRHTARFTVVGNHLAQHRELSLLAIGLAVHIQSLPTGARVDIRSLAERFAEGRVRIAAGLRELEAHGYLRRVRERTPAGLIVTRTVSCNQPDAAHRRTPAPPARDVPARTAAPADPAAARHGRIPKPSRGAGLPRKTGSDGHTAASPAHVSASPRPPVPRSSDVSPPHAAASPPQSAAADRQQGLVKQHRPLPPVPQPTRSSPSVLQPAVGLLAALHREDARLLLSACETVHLAPGVAAWLEREVSPEAVAHALTAGLPPEGLRRPAALLAHRLAARLPPPPPFRVPYAPPPARYPLHNCDGCDRAFRGREPGRCGDCRSSADVPVPVPSGSGFQPSAGPVSRGRR